MVNQDYYEVDRTGILNTIGIRAINNVEEAKISLKRMKRFGTKVYKLDIVGKGYRRVKLNERNLELLIKEFTEVTELV